VHTLARELAAVRVLLDRYGVWDPTDGLTRGVFADVSLQASYDRLPAEGLCSRADALRVTARLGADVVTLLEPALTDTDAPDVRHTYLHVLVAAHQQVRLAQRWSGR
jgi:hypothetical protein